MDGYRCYIYSANIDLGKPIKSIGSKDLLAGLSGLDHHQVYWIFVSTD